MKKTIIDYFDNSVKLFADNIAVCDASLSLTYLELERTSKTLAAAIIKNNFQHKPIALFMKRSAKLPAAVLGVLYSGNFYAVLDFESPIQRIEKILSVLSPAMIIYEDEFKDTVLDLDCDCAKLCYEVACEGELSKHDEDTLQSIRLAATSYDPAYALFTSGSTGFPKGALVTNQNVISYIEWFTQCFNINENTIFGSQTSMYFSMSVSDFYGSILTGGRYVIIPKEYFAFPAKLISFINEKKINSIYWVPSAMGIAYKLNLFKYCIPKELKTILFAGEVMPVKYLNYWKQYIPDALYANLFGPTETTDICSYYKVNREFENNESLPIGIACENCQLLVIKEDSALASIDEIGELYVKGPFVALGYYNNAQKTDEAFVQNPLHSSYRDIVYKTGDLVKKNSDGELLYMGRTDYQIKHMGYRIELSEIESQLNNTPDINLTVCIYDEKSDSLLLGYESRENKTQELKLNSLKSLPHYMQPAEFIRFDAFPKNANGKIDRKEIKNIILNK